MKSTAKFKVALTLIVAGLIVNSNANSVGFDEDNYSGGPEISVALIFDFTDFAVLGGGVNIEYDTDLLLFTGYTQAELPDDADAPASPIGSLTSPGLYTGVGIGTFDGFQGINSSGTIGIFTFTILNGPIFGTTTSCGQPLCILPNAINPFISLTGIDFTDEIIANGQSGANINLPIPAAAWLMLSGLLGLASLGRKSS